MRAACSTSTSSSSSAFEISDFTASATIAFIASRASVERSYSLAGLQMTTRSCPRTSTLNVTNLAAWQSTDELQIFSPGSGTAAYGMESNAISGAPQVAATSLAGFEYEFVRRQQPDLDCRLGWRSAYADAPRDADRRHPRVPYRCRDVRPGLVRHRERRLGDTRRRLPRRSARPPPTCRGIGPRSPPRWPPNAPGSLPYNYSTLAISTLAEADTRGFYASEPDVLIFAPGNLTDSTAVSATWAYGDPFPDHVDRVRLVPLLHLSLHPACRDNARCDLGAACSPIENYPPSPSRRRSSRRSGWS